MASCLDWPRIKKTVGVLVAQEHEYEGVDWQGCRLDAYPEFTTSE